jgi:hypothetical protein
VWRAKDQLIGRKFGFDQRHSRQLALSKLPSVGVDDEKAPISDEPEFVN